MRLLEPLIFAGALAVAAPAMAQDNAAAPVDNNMMAANMNATDMNAATPTTAAATPGAQDATLPATTDTTAVNETAPADDSDRGFPWGVLGLVGLIGLLGVRKVKA